MKIRHFLLCLVVLMSLWGVGCTPARSEPEYLKTGGCGEVSGRMNGVEFSAVVELSKNGERVRVEYLSPASLCGLVLTSRGDACEVSLGEMHFTCKATDIARLLHPASAFLLNGEAKSVQKEGENTVLTFSAGGTLTLSSKGEPISFASADMDLRVVWWQSGTPGKLGS